MRKQISVIIGCLLLVFFLTDCAKRGRPTGGEKDEDAPLMVDSKPKNYAINFKGDEIKIVFDEFVKLTDLNTQLIISPPLKNNPIITPVGTPSKTVTIQILDTLKDNTTYSFNFGQSLADNNEGNVFNNFKFVFSTGPIIDSLQIKGNIKDAFESEADKNVTVMLYEINDNFKDSVIYKEKPYYVGNTLDSTVWEITNIKAGDYLLMALNDKSRNYIYNPKEDKIGFVKQHITIPSDTSYSINMFKETLPFSLTRPSEVAKGHIQFGYEGIADSLQIKPINVSSDFVSTSNFEKEKDTLNYFYKGAVSDSIQFVARNKDYTDTVTVRLRSKKIDTLNLRKSSSSDLLFTNPFKVVSNIPLSSIDTTLISFVESDSIRVNNSVKISEDKTELIVDYKKEYNKKYSLELLPNAVADFFGNTNDTLKYRLSTKKEVDYGKLFVTLQDVKSYPIIVQLITDKGKVVKEIYATESQKFNFINLLPGKYQLRVIYDENENKKWDTGNFLLKKQPEKVIYLQFDEALRANWEKDETFILK